MVQPLVTIIIPNYNGISYVGPKLFFEALSSCLNQSYKNIEVILVDDASTDGTVAWVRKKFGKKIRFVFNPENLGFAGACNKGAEVAKGEYIYTGGTDLVMDKRCIEELMRFFLLCKNPRVAVASPIMFGLDDKKIMESGAVILPFMRARRIPLQKSRIVRI
jgi:GT2 family glycosyltransferase